MRYNPTPTPPSPQCYFNEQLNKQTCVSSLADSEEGQPVLSEHLHPSRRHESGVPRDDVRGHCLPASQGPGWHGEAPLIPHQVTNQRRHRSSAETSCDWITDPSFTGFFFHSLCFSSQLCKPCQIASNGLKHFYLFLKVMFLFFFSAF